MKKSVRLAGLAFLLALSLSPVSVLSITRPNPTYCGDPCYVPGDSTGCIFWRPDGVIARGTCSCSGGRWVC